ncbi:hypothetical protein EXU57_23170 [Segetibacter sp. 3557_3]|uniref:hypothetical protein n=1 Tax=Segetibacter sp. 3557_3 TaxID=2547429 RepID=UPI0010586066|nr:hypothetical protein [Segetibacter sp. 3557_3]TDH18501.1 hypothetical protein EXU57_23170 [Segetibacter sp. 3557_3]
MLKNIARTLGCAEGELDIFITMLVNALGAELEKVLGEVQDTRARVLERLVQLLCPEVPSASMPAHAVAHALPVEAATEVYEDAQFYGTFKSPSRDQLPEPAVKDIFFSPTATFHLNRASVRFMASGNLLFKVSNSEKEVIARSSGSNQLQSSTLWLGIDEPCVSIHNSLFYFELRNISGRQLFYHHLPNAQWFWNGVQLDHLPGYGDREISGETINVESLLQGGGNVSSGVKARVNAFYKPFFITLGDVDGLTSKKGDGTTPQVILNAFSGKEVEQMLQLPLRWIMIQFSDMVSNTLLQDVICNLNCFPVLNRKLYDVTYRLEDSGNIIPLKTDEAFFDLQQVNIKANSPVNFGAPVNQMKEAREVLVRNGGVGRFDERDAAASIDRLIQLLRDESAAFSTINKDLLSSEMKQLQQAVNRLNQNTSFSTIQKGSIPYLFLSGEQSLMGSISIKFWGTNGDVANNMNAGTPLRLYKGAYIQDNRAVLVTATRGGRDQLSVTEKLAAVRTALLSNDRLVTLQDIRAFCRYHLGDKAKKISIQKGVITLPGEQGGFKSSLDVIVELNENAYEGVTAKDDLCVYWQENLLALLNEKSAPSATYRVILKN